MIEVVTFPFDFCGLTLMNIFLSVLASWFRLKYPHIVIGAFASSAPILYFDHITPEDGYYSVVSKDFQV